MCGISGYFSNSINLNKKKKNKLKKLMAVRGPDGFGECILQLNKRDKVGFFHSRLKIIDPSNKSNQPMKDNEGLLIFNGMIYNYLEIKKILQNQNIKFKTNSDTEVLLKFLNFYGPSQLEKLDGMWSFAYYNFKEQSLTLSRDKFGEKPLYYFWKNKELIFGSNLNYISLIKEKGCEINYSKFKHIIKNSFRSLFLDDSSFFKDIKKIEAGTYLKINLKKKISIKRYWIPEKYFKLNKKKYEDNISILRHKFNSSIKKRLISDFPVSCALSGGIDSGSIVSTANQRFKKKIHSFSIKSKNLNYNENKNILDIVKKNKLKHTFVSIKKNTKKNLNDLEDIIEKTSSILPTTTWLIFNELCKQIKKLKYKVVMSGAGGDEMYGGYYIHHLHFLYSIRNKKYFTLKFDEWKKNVVPHIRSQKLKNFTKFKNLKNNSDRKFYEYLNQNEFTKTKKQKNKIFRLSIDLPYFKKNLYLDLYKFTLPIQLYSLDNISMYNGLESRVPLLSGDVYKHLLTIPSKYYIQNGYSKKILRDVVSEIMPKNIIKDRNKIGFFMNIDDLFDFKNKKLQNLILKSKFIRKVIDIKKVKNMMLTKNKNNQESHFLFTLINISLFIKKFEFSKY